MFRFSAKGVKIDVCEDYNENLSIKKFPSPTEVRIPLIQHIGEPAKPIVKKGDRVKVGEKIGQSDKFISSYIHSSVSGKVKQINTIPHPVLKEVAGIIIINDKQSHIDESILREAEDIYRIPDKEIITRIREAGIVGMGGAGFPTHVKLSPPKEKKLDSFILNGAECEPLLSADASLMVKKAKSVILGMKLAMRCVGIKRGYVGIEKSNPEAIDSIIKAIHRVNDKIFDTNIEVKVLPIFYPQGAEKQIIKTILNREVPPNKLPYEVGVIVNNVATCYAIYEAVIYRKPLYERIVTVAGDGVVNPGNFILPIGTKIGDIINYCGIRNGIKKIITGGPMMGDTQFSLDTPVIKGTGGIIVLKDKREDELVELNCIRCGRCVEVCPVNLVPTKIAQLVKFERWNELDAYNIEDCIECGACAYVCPSRIPLVHLIQLGKAVKSKV